jgi:uncharacterized membrane protein
MIIKTGFMKLCLLPLLIVIIAAATAAAPVGSYYKGYEYYDTVNETYFKQLILNIYVDEAGEALVTGYVEQEDIDSLRFLKTSESLYENDTNQLYALTNALTWKSGDNWGINFTTHAYYTEYHTIFYLPGDVKLFPGKIKCSEGLDYFVAASNESIVIDVQGYDVDNPMTMIEYQQPLRENGGEGTGFGFGYLVSVTALSVLAIALIIALVKMKRREGHEEVDEVKKGEIEVTSEMARVMETLTDRERTVVNALLKHGGEMTQADLRYETEIPKSSLSGILRTLERRKMIKKKEWGRTNVIELSEWFLGKKVR